MQDVCSNYHDTNGTRNPFLEFAERTRRQRCKAAAALEPKEQGRAAAATVEALMFCLRVRGTAALKEPKVSRRVSELSEPQMHEVRAAAEAQAGNRRRMVGQRSGEARQHLGGVP